MVLPKHMRLKGHRCFDFIYKEGSRFYSPSMVLRVTKANTKLEFKGINSKIRPSIKCAVSISNKVAKNQLQEISFDGYSTIICHTNFLILVLIMKFGLLFP